MRTKYWKLYKLVRLKITKRALSDPSIPSTRRHKWPRWLQPTMWVKSPYIFSPYPNTTGLDFLVSSSSSIFLVGPPSHMGKFSDLTTKKKATRAIDYVSRHSEFAAEVLELSLVWKNKLLMKFMSTYLLGWCDSKLCSNLYANKQVKQTNWSPRDTKHFLAS